jgi:flagellar assembly protein FliH
VRTDPNQIVGVMREAMALLPVNSRNIRVLLHPDDAEIVHELYAVGEGGEGWKVVEDPVVQRGGCRVVTDTSQVDATLESRLHNLIAPLIGGLRSADAEDA